jgi:hypothetical protein
MLLSSDVVVLMLHWETCVSSRAVGDNRYTAATARTAALLHCCVELGEYLASISSPGPLISLLPFVSRHSPFYVATTPDGCALVQGNCLG